RHRGGARQRRGPAAALQGAGSGAGGHHRPGGRAAAVRIARGARSGPHAGAAAGGAGPPLTVSRVGPPGVDPVRRRPRWRLLGRSAIGLALVLTVYVAVTFGQVYRASRHEGARSAEAIIVLGAAQYDGGPSPVFRDRLDHALD